MKLRPYTDKEWESLPHVFLTSDNNWDPSILDLNIDDDELWFDSISDDHEYPISHRYDEYGNYRNRVEVQSSTTTLIEDSIDICVMYHTHKHISNIKNDVISYDNCNDHFDDNCLVYFDVQQAETSGCINLKVLAGEMETTKAPIQVTPEEPEYGK